MTTNLIIRPVRLDDAPALARINAPYVTDTVISFDTVVLTAEDFRMRIRQREGRLPWLVAERDGLICGYAYTSPFVGRAAYRWCEETTIYLDTSVRHAGIGGPLYRTLEEVCRLRGVITLCACIGVPHKDDDAYLTHNSADFHAHMGYRTVGTFDRCGRKFDRWYDMVWMEKHLAPHPDHPAEVRDFADLSAEELTAAGVCVPRQQDN